MVNVSMEDLHFFKYKGLSKLTNSSGVSLKDSLDVVPWYAGKVEISQYLENINKEKKVCIATILKLQFHQD